MSVVPPPAGERGGIITRFLLGAVLMFALFGFAVFEAGAVIVAHVSVDGIARDAAREAALTYDRSNGSLRMARRECERLAARAGAVCVELNVRSRVATARVQKQAATLLIQRIGPLRRFAQAEARHSSPVP